MGRYLYPVQSLLFVTIAIDLSQRKFENADVRLVKRVRQPAPPESHEAGEKKNEPLHKPNHQAQRPEHVDIHPSTIPLPTPSTLIRISPGIKSR